MTAAATYAEAMVRKVIRADGTEETLNGPQTMRVLKQLIEADGIDVVLLRHLGLSPLWVMLVDDHGHKRGRPVNAKATALYHARCRPGTTHEIRGDVAIVIDEDFE